MNTQPFCNYVLLDELGRGGVSTVYRARDNRSGKVVALKLLKRQFQKQRIATERFQREPQMQFLHPKIVPVLEAGECEGQSFFTMELVEGRSLEQMLAAGALAPRQLFLILRDVSDALDAAHQRGIVHRDIKPSNILIRTSDNAALLTDFGVAKAMNGADATLFQTNVDMVGTVDYAAPELIRNSSSITPTADIYSLGVTAYYALSGKLPFVADDAFAVANMHLTREPMPLRQMNPRVSPEVSRVVMKAMRKGAEHRYPTAGAFANAFIEAVMQSQINAAQGGGWRRVLPVAIAAVLALVAVAAAAIWLRRAGPAPLSLAATQPAAQELDVAPTRASAAPPTPATVLAIASPLPEVTATPLAGDIAGPTATAAQVIAATATVVRAATPSQPPRPTATPRTGFAVTPEVLTVGRWGRPRSGCADFDDNDPVVRVESVLTIANTSPTKALSGLTARYYSSSGAEIKTCLTQGAAELPAGAALTYKVVAYSDDGNVASLRIGFGADVRRLCVTDGTLRAC